MRLSGRQPTRLVQITIVTTIPPYSLVTHGFYVVHLALYVDFYFSLLRTKNKDCKKNDILQKVNTNSKTLCKILLAKKCVALI